MAPLTEVDLRKAAKTSQLERQVPRLSGLIDPHNGDNGTDPAQTTTGARLQSALFEHRLNIDSVVHIEDDAPVLQTVAFCDGSRV